MAEEIQQSRQVFSMSSLRFSNLFVWLLRLIGAVSILILVLLTANAQDIVHIQADEEGKGVLRKVGRNCFVIAPTHVVGFSTEFSVTDAIRNRVSAELDSRYDPDVSLSRLTDSFACVSEWKSADWIAGTLPRIDTAAITTLRHDGSVKRRFVHIVEYNERWLVVRPFNRGDELFQGLSGSALIWDGKLLGQLISINTEFGTGRVLRQDHIDNILATRFASSNNQAAYSEAETNLPAPPQFASDSSPQKSADLTSSALIHNDANEAIVVPIVPMKSESEPAGKTSGADAFQPKARNDYVATTPDFAVLETKLFALKRSNIRGGPSTKAPVLGQLSPGQEIVVTGKSKDWFRVETAEDRQGFVFGKLLGEEFPVSHKEVAQEFYNKNDVVNSKNVESKFKSNMVHSKNVVKIENDFDVYTRNCSQGSAEGCTNLGWMYQKGIGVRQDISAASKLYERGCFGGFARGCTNLGWLYENAEGVARNNKLAAELYLQGCYSGSARACLGSGEMYRLGKGVNQNNVKAASFYKQSCDGGNLAGCNNLGVMYKYGNGVEQDKSQAIRWFRKSCDGGHNKGCLALNNIDP